MTRHVLEILAHGKMRPEKFVLIILVLPFTLAIDAIQLLLFRYRRHRALQSSVVTCEHGHEVELIGLWTCGSCGLSYHGHAWQGCPHDGQLSHSIACSCGMTIVSPISPWRK